MSLAAILSGPAIEFATLQSIYYGSNGCNQYDAEGSPECAATVPPTWCGSAWCYVDPATCKRPQTASIFFDGPSFTGTANDSCTAEQSLVFSYQTCGYLDSYSASREGFAASEFRKSTGRNRLLG